MSTFTEWNGPQGGHARTSDIKALIDAYNAMSSLFNEHINATVPGNAVVHGIKPFVEDRINDALKDYAPASELSKYATMSALETTYQKKADMPDTSDMATRTWVAGEFKASLNLDQYLTAVPAEYAKTEDIDRDYVSVARYDSEKASFANVADLANYLAVVTFTAHVDSHDTDTDGNLAVKNDLVLGKDKSVRFGTKDVVRITTPNSAITDDTGSEVFDAGLLLLGDDNKSLVPVSKQRMGWLDDDNKVHFYPLANELGTVPVGGIIEWPIDWSNYRGSDSRDDLLKYLKLDGFKGEWQPCDGAVIPPADTHPEFKEITEICGDNFPSRKGHIIHAMAAAETNAVSNMSFVMDTATLTKTLQDKINQVNDLISKYNSLIAVQDALIENNKNRIVQHITTPLPDVHSGKQFQSRIMSDVQGKYATKDMLHSEGTRAREAETQLTVRIDEGHDALRNEISKRAYTDDLRHEELARQASDKNLTELIVAEHIGAHEAIDKLRKQQRATDKKSQKAVDMSEATIGQLQTEHLERVNADNEIHNQLETNRQAVVDEAKLRDQQFQNNRDYTAEVNNRLEARIDSVAESGIGTAENLAAETSRAEAAEQQLQQNIDNEAQIRDQEINDAYDRAKDKIRIEELEREAADRQLQDNIDAEKARAEAAEQTLQDNIDAEKARAEAAEQTLQDNIDAEKERAETIERALQETISTVETESKERDDEISANLVEETENRIVDDQLMEDTVNQIGKQSVILIKGTQADLPSVTPAPDGTIIANGQKIIVNDSGTLRAYTATVDEDNNVTWEID